MRRRNKAKGCFGVLEQTHSRVENIAIVTEASLSSAVALILENSTLYLANLSLDITITDTNQAQHIEFLIMPTIERSEVITQLVTGCTFPKAADLTDLTDHSCRICQEPSLEPHGAEIPIKLRCGHVLGMTCLTTWVF